MLLVMLISTAMGAYGIRFYDSAREMKAIKLPLNLTTLAVLFEWLLDTIECEGYSLRPHYGERKGVAIRLRMSWLTLSSMVNFREVSNTPKSVSHPLERL